MVINFEKVLEICYEVIEITHFKIEVAIVVSE